MKKRNLNFLLVLLAALALVFAGACSDGSDEAASETPSDDSTSTETPSTSTETPGTSTETPGTSTETPGTSTETPGTSTETPGDDETEVKEEETKLTEVTADQVKGILMAIGDEKVATENTTGGEYWKFGSGTWEDATNEALATFTVEPSGSSNSPSITGTLANVAKLETQTATGDSSCSIDFSNVDWDTEAEPTAGSSGSGSITVTVTAGEGYSVPSALQSVTITFTSSSNWAE